MSKEEKENGKKSLNMKYPKVRTGMKDIMRNKDRLFNEAKLLTQMENRNNSAI